MSQTRSLELESDSSKERDKIERAPGKSGKVLYVLVPEDDLLFLSSLSFSPSETSPPLNLT